PAIPGRTASRSRRVETGRCERAAILRPRSQGRRLVRAQPADAGRNEQPARRSDRRQSRAPAAVELQGAGAGALLTGTLRWLCLLSRLFHTSACAPARRSVAIPYKGRVGWGWCWLLTARLLLVIPANAF